MSGPARHRGGVFALGILLLALTAAGAGALWSYDHLILFRLALAQGAIYTVAAFLLVGCGAERALGRRSLLAVLALGAAMRALLIPAPPVSTDIYRYVWDGRVQAAGINPYRHIPADEALASPRDEAIYPRINRGDYAPTIYPPTAQIVFYAVTRLSETVAAVKAATVSSSPNDPCRSPEPLLGHTNRPLGRRLPRRRFRLRASVCADLYEALAAVGGVSPSHQDGGPHAPPQPRQARLKARHRQRHAGG